MQLAPRDEIAPALAVLATLDDAAFRARFSGSPIKRIGPQPLHQYVLAEWQRTGF
jgi:epoxyqueuosine reductase QueG